MWQLSADSVCGNYEITDNTLILSVSENKENAFAEFIYQFESDGDEYVLFPACCYNGNRFKVLKKTYPPMFTKEESAVNMPVTITDVIRLNEDGSGKIEVTTGDESVPCIGIYAPERKQGMLFFTIQEIDGINLGLSYEKGCIGVTWPHMRKNSIYRWPFMKTASDCGTTLHNGEKIEIPYKLLKFPCESMEEFYKVFFENRKCMGLDSSRPDILPFDEQFEIQKNKFNAMNWREIGGFYGVGTEQSPEQTWQPGWVGGAISSYPLMKLGGNLEWERGMSTLRHLFRTQTESGFFYSLANSNGKVIWNSPNGDIHPIRESADILFFLFKHFNLMKERKIPVPVEFENCTRKLADAFVNMWDKYNQFGQFINPETGEILAGGSTSAAIAPASLVSAYRYFGEKRYLEIAVASAEQYYIRDAVKGYTTGGPAEILQCPDSESAFALLESLTAVYEETKDKIWLDRAEFMAWQYSSWVVSYNYHFPETSEFGKLGMKTVGSVFANAQNKHSAPGICNFSGDSLYKLYQWTNNPAYLELLKDTALSISQYMSTDKRPIYSWDVPKDASLMGDDSIRVAPEKLPQGFMCERVNMSDWESERCIGGVFNGSCWCETTNLLVLAEVVPLMQL